ncbi:MAG: sigma-70 family RNA polymerase sigma factor [Polyangiaceae bacterium]
MTSLATKRACVVRPTFRSVFDDELPFVWNALRRLGVPERDLEDVAHEVFLVVARLLPEYDPERSLRPWLFAIAAKTASSYRRRAQNRRESLLPSELDSADPTPLADMQLRAHEETNLARKALLAVPEDRRSVLVLHDFEGVPMQEITAALDIPLKTGYSRLRIGREELIAAARRLAHAPSLSRSTP